MESSDDPEEPRPGAARRPHDVRVAVVVSVDEFPVRKDDVDRGPGWLLQAR